MASSAPLTPNGRLRYSAAPVFERADLACVVNVDAEPFTVDGVVLASEDLAGGELPPGTGAWMSSHDDVRHNRSL